MKMLKISYLCEWNNENKIFLHTTKVKEWNETIFQYVDELSFWKSKMPRKILIFVPVGGLIMPLYPAHAIPRKPMHISWRLLA